MLPLGGFCDLGIGAWVRVFAAIGGSKSGVLIVD
jgi:hypothetical protein